MKLKILSWNIWFDGKFEGIAEFLIANQADIIGLQEVVADDKNHDAISLLKKLGYNYAFGPAAIVKRLNKHFGNAIFTKHEIISDEVLTLSEKESRSALRADIKIENKIMHVYSTHLLHTHQKPSEIQSEQARNLINNIPQDNVVIMGDFNATPESDAIKIMETKFQKSDPANQPTWSLYPEGCPVCNPQKIDTRLDYFFTSKGIKVISTKVESAKDSDHLPISMEIEI